MKATNGDGHVAIELHDGHDAVQDAKTGMKQAQQGPRPSTMKHPTSVAHPPPPTSTLLVRVEDSCRIILRFDGVSAHVPTLVLPGNGKRQLPGLLRPCLGGKGEEAQQAPRDRQILHGVSGEVNPGEVLALMGPSGGGKTSLLALLGGRSTARLEGTITFNGAKMNKAVKRKLGYVMQDDLLFAELTVYETLY
ncbi:ABC transporter G family member 26, partial [Tetrabaena socialis]